MSPLNDPRGSSARVVDAFALSSTQAGMLFHALQHDPGHGVDVQQISMTVQHPLDPALYVYAWYSVMERHPVLRSRLRWEGLDEPRQEVLDAVELPVERADWRGLEPGDIRGRLLAIADRDRAMGFDLTQAPLMRLHMARVGECAWSILWTFHHVLLDGRSFPQVLRESFEIHDNLRLRREVVLPPALPYRNTLPDAVEIDEAADERYWRRRLEGVRGPTPLGIDLSQGQGTRVPPGNRFGARQRSLGLDATMALRERAKLAGLSLNTLLMGAWSVLLQRCGNSQDVVFGTTRSYRHLLSDPDAACVGMHINTLPMRVRVDPARPIDDWLAEIREQQLAMRPHELTPLSRIQGWVGLPPGTPLFETLVVYDHASLGERMQAWGPPWDMRRFDHVGQTGYPLALVAYGDPQLLLRLEYDRRRFSDGLMERLLGHLETVLMGLAEDRCERIGDLPWLTAAEFEDLVGPPATVFAESPPLHRLFEQNVARTPHAPALTAVDERGRRQEWTYAQLNRSANRLAHRLREAGVAPNQLVGLRAERNADVAVGLLAILKAGAAYLPLDPVYPLERAAWMLDDAGAQLLLVSASLDAEWERAALARMVIEADPDAAADPARDANPVPVNAPGDLAYVIYTSGSTGQPKGVQISHANVTRLFAATQADYRFDDRDVWTLFHSYAFDFSVWEIWGALLHGGRLVTVSMGLSRDIEAFCELLVRERVTVLNQTPTAFRRLIDVACQGPVLPLSLRYVIFGGEALELQMLRPWFERYGDARPQLVNMYGITETTVHVSYRPLQMADLDEAAGSVIGEPIADLKILLLDEQGRLVPRGVPGEIAVGGAGVGLGYLHRPDLTAQRFVADPFNPQPGARLYLSGDLARWLDNGDLEYLGRRDQQVKIRGFRIELGEIEAALSRHPHVRQAAVVAREDSPGDKRLAAYVVPALLGQGVREGATEPELAAQLRTMLRETLPEYMVPPHIVCIEELPLTGNGKLDVRALPAPHEHRPARSSAADREAGATEAALARIWAMVLRLDHVGLDDHFFELGGDSILSIQIVARSRQEGLKVQLKDLFECPTVAQLAQRLDARGHGRLALQAEAAEPSPGAVHPQERPAHRPEAPIAGVAAPAVSGPAAPITHVEPAPLAPVPMPPAAAALAQAAVSAAPTAPAAQEVPAHPAAVAAVRAPQVEPAEPAAPAPATQPDLLALRQALAAPLMPIQQWFFEQSFRDAHHWNQAFWFTLPARITTEQVQRAWQSVQAAHRSLHERYQRTALGDWVVVTADVSDEPAVVHVDLSGLGASQARAVMEERALEAQSGLDIERGPLARLLHVHLSAGQPARLLLVIHHLAVDGVSWRILREDLEACLLALEAGQPTPALMPTTSVQDWAAALRASARHPAVRATSTHWVKEASRATWTIPGDAQATRGEPVVHRRQLTAEITRSLLQQLPARFGAPMQAALLTSLARALHGITGAEAWRIDLEGHGREPVDDDLDVSRTVGWFTSLFPFVLEHESEHADDPAQALRRMHQRWEALPTRGLGYGVLRWLSDDADLRRALSQTPSAPLVFNYLGQFDAVVAGSELFGFAEESTGPWRSARAQRSHPVEIVAQVRAGQLTIGAEHDAADVASGWVESLLDGFVAAIAALAQVAQGQVPVQAAPVTWRMSAAAPTEDARWAGNDAETETDAGNAAPRLDAAPVAAPTRVPVAAPPDEAVSPAQPQARVTADRLAAFEPAMPDEAGGRSAEPAHATDAAAAAAAAVAAEAVDEGSSYPLTPMQRLFFAMDDARPELGLEQWQFRLEGPLNPTRLRRALSRVIERHEVLRSAFLPGDDGLPVQQPMAVHEVRWVDDDWRALSAVDQERRLQGLLADDREQRFDLRQPPLMRVQLLRRGDALWHLVWTTHHLTMDGWSWPLVLAEWSRAYAALESGHAPTEPPAVPYRRYVDALPQLAEGSEVFWRRHLSGLTEPTPLVALDAPADDPSPAAREWTSTVPEAVSSALVALGRRWRLTPGTLVYAAWACVLAHRASARSVAFGATLAGRPPELPGVEHLVGPCVNNVPVHLAVPPEQPLAAWLSMLQALQFDLSQHQYLPLEQIQQVSQVPWHQRLFDSLVVFQNYQIDPDARRIGVDVDCHLLAAPEATNFPLTLTVGLGAGWRLRWLSGAASVSQDTLRVLDASLQRVLRAFCAAGEQTVGDVLQALPAEGRGCAVPPPQPAQPKGLAAVHTGPATATGFGSGPAPTEREAELAALWGELLGRTEVPLDTNFFDMGVHSLLLVRAHRLIQERLDTALPLLALVRHPTIRSLARLIDAGGQEQDDGVADAARERVRRLRLAQQRQRLGAYGRRSIP